MIDVMVDDKGTQDVQPEPTQENLPKEAQNSRGSYAPLLFFVFASLLYMVLSIQIIDAKYVDFGDGNYLYLSWRLAEGEVLYQDLPSPQPPLHLFVGGALLWLTGGDPVLVRLWQVVQHVLIACCVVGIASRIFKNSAISFLAGTIYLFLPEGVWWAAGYQSEGLLILLQSFNVLLFLTAIEQEKPSLALYGSAVTSALCCFVNMTALPYMALQWFFVWFRYRHSFYRYSTALIVPGLLLFGYMVFYSNGQYLEHVFNRQVGTYPTDSLWGMLAYFAEKLYTEGGDILYYEGGFVFAAMAGLFLFAGDEENEFAKDYTLWWGGFSIGSI
ncbi:hypothetical protein GF373_10705, partial [bacterium]|nr:hypothetical protein [bacterium]